MTAKNKKIIIIAFILAIIIGLSAFFIIKSRQSAPEIVTEQPKPKKKKITVPSNIVPLSDRPEIAIVPFQAKNGRSLRISLLNVPKAAASAEFLMEYEVGGATSMNAAGKTIATPDAENPVGLQGTMGEIALGQYPSSTEILLGTCSAGGACTLNKGLGAGDVTITFAAPSEAGDGENYAISSAFTYFENEKSDLTKASTTDGNFTITSPSLKTVKDYIFTQVSGLPQGLPATAVTYPDSKEGSLTLAYQLSFTSPPASSDDFTVSLVDPNPTDGQIKTIFSYDTTSKTWSPATTTQNEAVYTTTGQLADVYALVLLN